MLAVSNGGSSFGTGGGLAGSPRDCGRGLVGGGGILSAGGGFPGSCTFGGGVGVTSGGDFTGSDCARTVAGTSALRRNRQMDFGIRRRKSKSFRLSNEGAGGITAVPIRKAGIRETEYLIRKAGR